jgi:hypothetical protein
MIKKLNFLAVVFFIVVLILGSYLVLSQPATGQFRIANQAPFIQANSFEVQDSATTFDFTNPIDTHDFTPTIRWVVRDPNQITDFINTSICIGTIEGSCDVLSFTSAGVNLASGTTAEFNYTGTGINIDQGTHCNAISCTRDYYFNVTVDDGNKSTSETNIISFINQVPNIPTSLNPLESHNQTPFINWTASDNDNGVVDRWPADTLTHYIQVGQTSPGDVDYLDSSTASSGAVVTSAISYGTPGALEARNTVQVRYWVQDNILVNSSFNDTTFDVFDSLPQFVDVYLSDSGDLDSSTSCIGNLQPCSLNPSSGNYSAINITFSTTDLDGDCSSLTHNGAAVLCLVNASSGLGCDSVTNANFTFPLTLTATSGGSCNFSISMPKGNSNSLEFFKEPDTYRMYLNASSQAGISTTVFNFVNWTYNPLTAISYPSAIFLGDRIADGGDGIQLGTINPGLFVSTMVNQGNIPNNVSWTATDPSVNGEEVCNTNTATCWDLSTSPDLQLDDDILFGEGAETGLVPINISEDPSIVGFEPFGGLQICEIFECNTGINEQFNTTYHISPPLGLSPGDYETNITIVLS